MKKTSTIERLLSIVIVPTMIRNLVSTSNVGKNRDISKEVVRLSFNDKRRSPYTIVTISLFNCFLQ